MEIDLRKYTDEELEKIFYINVFCWPDILGKQPDDWIDNPSSKKDITTNNHHVMNIRMLVLHSKIVRCERLVKSLTENKLVNLSLSHHVDLY